METKAGKENQTGSKFHFAKEKKVLTG